MVEVGQATPLVGRSGTVGLPGEVKAVSSPALQKVVKFGVDMLGRDWQYARTGKLQELFQGKGLETDTITKEQFEELIGFSGDGLDQFWAMYADANGNVTIDKLSKMMEDLSKTSEATGKPLQMLMQAKSITFVKAGSFADWWNGLSDKQKAEYVEQFPQIREILGRIMDPPRNCKDWLDEDVVSTLNSLSRDKLDQVLFGVFDSSFCEDYKRTSGDPLSLKSGVAAKFFLAGAYTKYIFEYDKVHKEEGELDDGFLKELQAAQEKLARLKARLEAIGSIEGLQALDQLEAGIMSKPEYQERLEAIYTAFEKGGADQKTVDDLVALSKETVAVKKAEDAQRRAAAEAAALGGSTQAVPVDMGARYYYRPYGSYGYGGHIHPPK